MTIPALSPRCDIVVWSVARLLAALLDWKEYKSSDDPGFDGSDFQALIKTLKDVSDWEGYALARELDRAYSIDMSADIVSALDTARHYQRSAHEILVRELAQTAGGSFEPEDPPSGR